MKNLLVSAFVIGALACPVVHANETKDKNASTESTHSMGLEAKPAPKKRHKKAHMVKKHDAPKYRKHMSGDKETKAEKKIDEETELNNR